MPNVHLQNGATLVAYSGGKCLRGPQTGGLLLGRKDLVRAAWVHSAPHHGFDAFAQGRQGRRHRDADGGRDVGQARPRRRVEALDRLARSHRAARVARSPASRRPSCSRTACPIARRRCASSGIGRSSASPATPSSRALLDGEPRIALAAARRRPAAADRRVGHAVHDGGRATSGSSPTGCTRCCRSRRRSRRRRAGGRRSRISPASGTCASSTRRRRRRTRCT